MRQFVIGVLAAFCALAAQGGTIVDDSGDGDSQGRPVSKKVRVEDRVDWQVGAGVAQVYGLDGGPKRRLDLALRKRIVENLGLAEISSRCGIRSATAVRIRSATSGGARPA